MRDPLTSRRRRTGMALAGVTACISGVAVFTNGYAVGSFANATVYTTAKNLVAAGILLVVALAALRRQPADRRGRSWPGLLAVGVIGGGLPFVLFFEGLARASSGDAAFLHKTLVVWVALLAVPLLGERLTGWHVGAVAVLVGGQVVLLGGGPDLAAGGGEVMILAATLLWSVEVVVAKRLLDRVHPLRLGAARLGIGVVFLLAWLGVSGRLGDLLALDAGGWGWALLTGALLAGYVGTWYAALARAQAVDVTAILVGGAVITALLNAGVKGVDLAPQALGLGLLVAGVGLLLPSARRRVT